jgi:hypothetical protein
VSAPIVNPRLTIEDLETVSAEDTTILSAVLDHLPVFRALTGTIAGDDEGVRGISPGYYALGVQANPLVPTNVVIDEDSKASFASIHLVPIDTGDFFVLEDLAGPSFLISYDGNVTLGSNNFGQHRTMKLDRAHSETSEIQSNELEFISGYKAGVPTRVPRVLTTRLYGDLELFKIGVVGEELPDCGPYTFDRIGYFTAPVRVAVADGAYLEGATINAPAAGELPSVYLGGDGLWLDNQIIVGPAGPAIAHATLDLTSVMTQLNLLIDSVTRGVGTHGLLLAPEA